MKSALCKKVTVEMYTHRNQCNSNYLELSLSYFIFVIKCLMLKCKISMKCVKISSIFSQKSNFTIWLLTMDFYFCLTFLIDMLIDIVHVLVFIPWVIINQSVLVIRNILQTLGSAALRNSKIPNPC